MKVAVHPPVDEPVCRMLATILGDRGAFVVGSHSGYHQAWRHAGLREGAGVERDGAELRYALSPRSTRGATRA